MPGLDAFSLKIRWSLRLLPLVLVLWLGSTFSAMAGSFQVSPTRFEFLLNQRFTNFFTITNNSNSPLRLQIYARFIEVGDTGSMEEVEDSPFDLSRWLVFNPRRVTLAPQEKRVVRFSVRPPADLAPGEYRTVVFFEELPAPPTSLTAQQNADGVALQLSLLTRLGVSLYGIAGEPNYQVRYLPDPPHLEPTHLVVGGLIENIGNAHVTLNLRARLFDLSGNEVLSGETTLVLQRDLSRRWRLEMPRPGPGQYTLELVGMNELLQPYETTYPLVVE